MPKKLNPSELEWNRNEDAMRLAWTPIRDKIEIAAKGGGQSCIDKEHEKGKLTARERMALLFDAESSPIEIGALAGEGMYEEHGGCPGGGVVVKIGHISGRLTIVVANDATVKAGAWFPITGKKNLRAQEIAMENRLPIVYLVDSAGVFLPMQNEIFPDKEHFGRMFRNNAKMSAMGIPQIAAVMGACVAGGAYLPIMSDEALIVKGTGSIFLAGSYLVKAAIGESIDNETLGGAQTHSSISGIVDHACDSEEEALATIRKLIGHFKENTNLAGFQRSSPVNPSGKSLCGILPPERNQPYDTMQLIDSLVDAGSFTEFKKDYGKTIITGFARIDGWSVGIIANQRKLVKSKTDGMQFGGVIYSDSADKSARFIMNCNQKGIPLVFIQDVTGFMVGSRSEHGGIIKDGAKMVNAVANSTVPKFTVIVGNSYGAGNYAMCGKAYDPRLIIAWPTAKLAVMGGDQAAEVLQQIEISRLKKLGEMPDEKAQQALHKRLATQYEEQTHPLYAAARLWVDAIINPDETRHWISTGIAASNHSPIEEFKTGVIQT
ncbi:MAG: acyl-CoA carboxylase subunit beta [Flavobacteriales bacterium]